MLATFEYARLRSHIIRLPKVALINSDIDRIDERAIIKTYRALPLVGRYPHMNERTAVQVLPFTAVVFYFINREHY